MEDRLVVIMNPEHLLIVPDEIDAEASKLRCECSYFKGYDNISINYKE